MKIFGHSSKFSFRSRISVLVIGMILAVVSLVYTNKLANVLKQKEQHDVELWVAAMERVSREYFGDYMTDPLISHIVSTQNNIPFIITDQDLNLVSYNRIPEDVIKDPEKFRRKLNELTEENTPRTVRMMWMSNRSHIIFYGKSSLLRALYYFPYVQWVIIAIFIVFTYIALQSTKQDEQNRVWIGLAKETAHQLGTPTSSLLGWIEYLRTQNVDPMVVEEMNKDMAHLLKIVDRFSKIGSETVLTPTNVNEVVGETIMYFRKRIPRNVTLVQRSCHGAREGEPQCGAVRVGCGEPSEERSGCHTGPRRHRCGDPRQREDCDHRCQGYGQGHTQEQLETYLRAGLHDQDPRLGSGALALAPYRRGLPSGQDRRGGVGGRARHDVPHNP